MKPFHFKKFSIKQSKDVFRVGTDGVLLGALVNIENSQRILEVGSGSGLISLMIAQRNLIAIITAIDISAEAVKLSDENFKNSPFNERLNCFEADFKHFAGVEKFDLIVSNPPYFKENDSSKDVIARQQTSLSFENLIKLSAEKLKIGGLFSIIIPAEFGDTFTQTATENKLFLNRKITIYGIKNSKPKRLILEFGFEDKEMMMTELIIEKSPRIFTDEYLKLTKDFHLFGK